MKRLVTRTVAGTVCGFVRARIADWLRRRALTGGVC